MANDFLTTYCGLQVAQATVVTSCGLLVDVIINPLAGFISDSFNNTKLGRKFGRRRFFIILAVPLLFLLNVLLWRVVEDAFWYYFAIYTCYNIVYTFVMVPYNALPSEMTEDFKERTYLGGLKAIFGKMANFLVNALPGIFFLFYGEKSEQAFVVMGVCFGVIMALAMLFVYLTTWEQPAGKVTSGEQAVGIGQGMKKLFTEIGSAFRLRTFRDLLGMYLFGFGAEWLYNASFVYFVMYVLFLPKTQAAFWQSLSPIMQLISTIIVMGLVAKGGFRKPYISAEMVVAATVLSYVAIGFFGNYSVDNPASGTIIFVITGIVALFGLGTGAVYYIPWQAYIFVPDADEIVTGYRRAGTYAAAMTLCGKIMNAVVVAILGFSLSLAGFQSGNGTQPASVTSAILLVMLIGIVGLTILGAISAKRMKLDKNTDKILINESKRVLQDGGKMEDVDPEVKKICEQITGVQYELCFGHNTWGYHTAEERDKIKKEMSERKNMNFGSK